MVKVEIQDFNAAKSFENKVRTLKIDRRIFLKKTFKVSTDILQFYGYGLCLFSSVGE